MLIFKILIEAVLNIYLSRTRIVSSSIHISFKNLSYQHLLIYIEAHAIFVRYYIELLQRAAPDF